MGKNRSELLTPEQLFRRIYALDELAHQGHQADLLKHLNRVLIQLKISQEDTQNQVETAEAQLLFIYALMAVPAFILSLATVASLTGEGIEFWKILGADLLLLITALIIARPYFTQKYQALSIQMDELVMLDEQLDQIKNELFSGPVLNNNEESEPSKGELPDVFEEVMASEKVLP